MTLMSDTLVVLLIGGIAFAIGLLVALRFFPLPAPGATGDLVAWVARLVAGGAFGASALDIYSVAKRQSEQNLATDPVELADGLAQAISDLGVLFALAVGLAVVGTLLVAGDRSATEAE